MFMVPISWSVRHAESKIGTLTGSHSAVDCPVDLAPLYRLKIGLVGSDSVGPILSLFEFRNDLRVRRVPIYVDHPGPPRMALRAQGFLKEALCCVCIAIGRKQEVKRVPSESTALYK